MFNKTSAVLAKTANAGSNIPIRDLKAQEETDDQLVTHVVYRLLRNAGQVPVRTSTGKFRD